VRTSHTLSPQLDSYASYFAAIRLMDGPETQSPALQFLKSLDDLDEDEPEDDDDDDEVEDLDEDEEDEDDFGEDEDDDDDEDEEDDEDGGVRPLKMA
jgi:hypothetical protein